MRVYLVVVIDNKLSVCPLRLLAVTQDTVILACKARRLELHTTRVLCGILVWDIVYVAQSDPTYDNWEAIPRIRLHVFIALRTRLCKVQASTKHSSFTSERHVKVILCNRVSRLWFCTVEHEEFIGIRLQWGQPNSLQDLLRTRLSGYAAAPGCPSLA